MSERKKSVGSRMLSKILGGVERAGNALPNPAILFLVLTVLVVVGSWLAFKANLTAVHPIKNDVLTVVNLLSIQGLHYVLLEMVKNFTGFAPLGIVLVALLGFSLAEKSGLISTLLRAVVLRAPRSLIVPAVLTAGVLSHTASDIGYVLLIPLAAMVFHAVGLHPLAGLACSFAGVSGGFAANFLLSGGDALLAGLTQEAARIIDPTYTVSPLVNYYFMAASSVVIILIGTLITNKIVIPYLGPYRGDTPREELNPLTKLERRGLWGALAVTLGYVALICWGLIPADGFLRDPKSGSVVNSPVVRGIIPIIFFVSASAGLAYGWLARTMRSQTAVVNAMQETMASMAPYLVLVFFASQFIALFNHSNMGVILAVHGSEFLRQVGLGGFGLMISFIFLTIILDLFMGSASAKWALMAPVFVPMFMLLGYAPELTQASYRIGDSVVNIISPLMSYFPLILAFASKYDKSSRVGTVIALMLPYSIAFTIFWSALLFVWMMFALPLGPGAAMFYSVPVIPPSLGP